MNSRRTDPKLLPVEPAVKSTRRGWVGLEAAHFRTTPAFELHDAVLPIGTHGISNVAASEQVHLAVRGGAILVCHLRLSA